MESRIRFTRASQVFERYPDLADTVAEPSADVSPVAYVKDLLQGEEPLTALAYLSHSLPKREAVWWALKCVQGAAPGMDEGDRTLLDLSETWVREGDEEARVAVHAAAEQAKGESAAVWIARAAGWSGGSLSPLPDQRVDMPDDLTAKAANTALLIALGPLEPEAREDALPAFVSAGVSFAEGGAMPAVAVRGPAEAL